MKWKNKDGMAEHLLLYIHVLSNGKLVGFIPSEIIKRNNKPKSLKFIIERELVKNGHGYGHNGNH